MKKVLTVLAALLFLFQPINYSQSLDLIGHHSLQDGEFVTDVWGYVNQAGKEYAIVGSFFGIEIFDISDPANPQQVYYSGSLPGFDLKIWQNYLYLVTGSGGANLGKILDISDPSNPVIAGSFNSAHNIFISDDGYLFAEFPGLTVYNLNNTPASPEFVWSDGTAEGHDATVIKNKLYDFHGNATNIYEFSTENDFTVQLLGYINDPLIQYHHSGWITDDDKYLFICDEISNHPKPDITVWDISNLSEPIKVDEYADPDATVHNLYIIDNYAYVSYYTAGFRIFDITDPENIEVAAHYDTSPASGQGFDGAFGVYPFLPSGNILVSDTSGLFIFKFNKPTGIKNEDGRLSSFKLFQNYPNPFNPTTKLSFEIGHQSFVSLKVYDLIGNEIAVLVNEEKPSGNYNFEFKPGNLTSGVYFCELRTGEKIQTIKMLYLK